MYNSCSFTDLPPELLIQIAEVAIARDAWLQIPRDKRTVLSLSVTSRRIRDACFPPLLSYVRLTALCAPALLRLLKLRPELTLYVQCLNLHGFIVDGQLERWKAFDRPEWKLAATQAIMQEDPLDPSAVELSADSAQLLSTLTMCLIKRLRNLNQLEGVDVSLSNYDQRLNGQLYGDNVQILSVEDVNVDLDDKDRTESTCPGTQLMMLFRDCWPSNLYSLQVSHHCRQTTECMWHTSQSHRWLPYLGAGLRDLSIVVSGVPFASFTSSLPTTLSYLRSLQTLCIALYEHTYEHTGATGADLDVTAEAIINAEGLSQSLKNLQLHFPCMTSAPRSFGNTLLYDLAHFAELCSLTIPFPRITESGTHLLLRLPPKLIHLIFNNVYDDIYVHAGWMEWMDENGTLASLHPLESLSAAAEVKSLPSSLRTIQLGISADPGDQLDDWHLSLISRFKDALIDLDEACFGTPIMVEVSDDCERADDDPTGSIDGLIHLLEILETRASVEALEGQDDGASDGESDE